VQTYGCHKMHIVKPRGIEFSRHVTMILICSSMSMWQAAALCIRRLGVHRSWHVSFSFSITERALSVRINVYISVSRSQRQTSLYCHKLMRCRHLGSSHKHCSIAPSAAVTRARHRERERERGKRLPLSIFTRTILNRNGYSLVDRG
jgi:hypothetical protein